MDLEGFRARIFSVFLRAQRCVGDGYLRGGMINYEEGYKALDNVSGDALNQGKQSIMIKINYYGKLLCMSKSLTRVSAKGMPSTSNNLQTQAFWCG